MRGAKELHVVDVADEAGSPARARRARSRRRSSPIARSRGRRTATGSRTSTAGKKQFRIRISCALTGGDGAAGELSLPTRTAARSRGARTARSCCSTRRSAPRTADRARRSRAAHAALSRGPVPRSLQHRCARAATAAAHAARTHARARREIRAPRTPLRRTTQQRSATARHSRDATAPRAPRIDASGRNASHARRVRRHPLAALASCRSASTSERALSARRQDALLTATAAGQANLYIFPLDELATERAGRAAAHVDAGLQGATRSGRPTARRSTTSRTAASTRSTSSRARAADQRDRGARRRLRAREARGVHAQRGATCATTSSTRR